MPVVATLKALGVDTDNQISVVRTIRSLAINDSQKQQMLEQYLKERNVPLTTEARKEATFL